MLEANSAFRLEGKVAVVTGCRRGIGRAIAVALAQAGADIIGVSAHLEPEGSAVSEAVGAAGRRFHASACDFADRAALYAWMEQAKSRYPTPDILINNAGSIARAPAVQYSDTEWDRLLETNLTSAFILARTFGREMVERGSGKIIFLASLLTFQGGVTVPGYAASKGGVGQLTKALANEWAGKGVNVNAIAPGYIETDNTEALRQDPQRNSSILARIPAGRWGQPEEIAGAAVFLASPAAAYIHGTVLTVDGGWMGR